MKKIIVANWKANLSPKEALRLARKYSALKIKDLALVVCPDFLSIQPLAVLFKKTSIILGAQDCSAFSLGAHTGEISASSLKSAGASQVIIGHSERRTIGESNEIICQKVKNSLAEKLTPIICIGESAVERRQKKTAVVLKRQLSAVFSGLTKEQLAKKILVAYEPIWAIGTGRPLDAKEANNLCGDIKKIAVAFGASNIFVLYGGSVNDTNAEDFLSSSAIDGLLLGGASLKFQVFSQVVNRK